MTSAWNEPPGRDDRAGGEDAGPDDNQLDMFEILRRSGSSRPSAASTGSRGAERTVEIVGPSTSTRDFLDVGGPDSDELRRLEESIRWLMNAGNVRHLPPAATPPMTVPSPLESKRRDLHRDDSLILDPETLFSPRAPQHQGDILRGAAKILLVSAIAAPAAYFAASWAQFPGPADPAVVSSPAPAGSVQVAALEPASAAPMQEATRSVNVATAPPPEHVAAPVVEKAPPVGTGPTELKVAPPEQPSPMSSVPAQTVRGGAEMASPAIPVAAPPKPTMRAEDVTLMVDRGRTLFEAGDVAAARLFFRRAANAGDPGAAVAMGATYDPEILTQRFIRGIEADAQEAQRWYEKARALGGGGGGGSRIEMLAHR
jgi:TPR repeat protein